MNDLVFGCKFLTWAEAQELTFTSIELLYKQAKVWLEERERKRKRD